MTGKPTFSTWYRELQHYRKAGIWVGAILIFYTFLGFLVTPLVLKTVLEKKLPEILARQVVIDKIRLNPYSLSTTIEGFHLVKKEGGADFVYFKRLYVNLESLSIFKKALIIQAVVLDEPFIDFEYLGNRTYSFTDLMAGAPGKEAEKPSGQGAALFSINNIEIKNGNIKFHDLPKGKVHQVVDLNLAIPSLSNLPSSVETYVQPAFSAVINGTPTSLGGSTKPFAESLATEVNIKMNRIDIPAYLAYIPNPTGLTISSALMDIDAGLTYLSGNGNTSRLSLAGTITIKDINVVDHQDRSYLKLPSLTLTLADSNLLAKEIRFAGIEIDSPQLEVLRLADGELQPISLLSSSEADIGETPPETKADTGEQQVPVSLTVDRLILKNGGVIFSDRALRTPAATRIDKIFLEASSLSTIPDSTGKINLTMHLNETGTVSAGGDLSIDPFSLKATVDVESVRLKPFQSYLAEQARIIIKDGVAGLKGNLEVLPGSTQEGRIKINCSGNISIADLALADTVIGDDLLKWRDLRLKNLAFSARPAELSIGEISLQEPYAKILINDDGTINFATLARNGPKSGPALSAEPAKPAHSPGEASSTGAKTRVTIEKVSFIDGQVQFLDKSVNPAYGTILSDFNGTITGLSSRQDILAAMTFSGKVDQQAPLAIGGEINPLRENSYADIKIDFRDFNMSALSPYTGKFIGYKTGKGKLSLDMHYNIAGKKLDSTNKAFLDQFTLGDQVESSEATALPVSLAISLLKDRQGEIFLNIPVKGDLDDPEFSIGGVIIRVIINLIAKAATSPFALLGSLIPEGTDIQHIPFEAGRSSLTEAALDKLKVVANVLYERPGLKMDIVGRLDRENDRRILARQKMGKLVKLEKLRKTGEAEKAGLDYRSIEMVPDEYAKYLDFVYQKALKEAPPEERKAAKKNKPADPAEKTAMQEKFILARTAIEDEDLRLLAIARANSVLNHLVDYGQVEPGRLFVLEPQVSGEVEKGQNVAMVELTIK